MVENHPVRKGSIGEDIGTSLHNLKIKFGENGEPSEGGKGHHSSHNDEEELHIQAVHEHHHSFN